MEDEPAFPYVVVARGGRRCRWCPDLEHVLSAMRFFGPRFGCEVVRAYDNCPLWPLRQPGGTA